MGNLELLLGVLTAIALGQSLLTASLLVTSAIPVDIRAPLIIFFLANAVTEFSSLPYLFEISSPSLEHGLILSGIPATLLLAPAIWIYLLALTSEHRIRFEKRFLWHLVPCLLGILVCIAMGIVSEDVREQIFGDQTRTDAPIVVFSTILVVGIVLINVIQLIGYIFPMARRLLVYWKRLHDLYANTDKRDLSWVIWMLALLLINVAWAVFGTFFDTSNGQELVGEFANVALIWMLSVWGLRQLPGLRPNPMPHEIATGGETGDEPAGDGSENPRYAKSALSEEQIEKIAENVERAMLADTLYLDPNLSLRHLAKHISTYPNYVSQTLNGRLESTFFDYINGWRIRDAMPRLAESDEQVTNIAYDVGFNSRSSFYNAFKRETGETPTQYRQRVRAGA